MGENWFSKIFGRRPARYHRFPDANLSGRFSLNVQDAESRKQTQLREAAKRNEAGMQESLLKYAAEKKAHDARIDGIFKEVLSEKFKEQVLSFIRTSVADLEKASRNGERTVGVAFSGWEGTLNDNISNIYWTKAEYPVFVQGAKEGDWRRAPSALSIISELQQMPEYVAFSRFCKKEGLVLSLEPVYTEHMVSGNGSDFHSWESVRIAISLSFK